MSVTKSSTSAVQPPPDLPDLGKNATPALTNYLRTFGKWCTDRFQDRTPTYQALPYVLLQASDPPANTTPKVFKVTVSTAGALVVTNVPLGQGLP